MPHTISRPSSLGTILFTLLLFSLGIETSSIITKRYQGPTTISHGFGLIPWITFGEQVDAAQLVHRRVDVQWLPLIATIIIAYPIGIGLGRFVSRKSETCHAARIMLAVIAAELMVSFVICGVLSLMFTGYWFGTPPPDSRILQIRKLVSSSYVRFSEPGPTLAPSWRPRINGDFRGDERIFPIYLRGVYAPRKSVFSPAPLSLAYLVKPMLPLQPGMGANALVLDAIGVDGESLLWVALYPDVGPNSGLPASRELLFGPPAANGVRPLLSQTDLREGIFNPNHLSEWPQLYINVAIALLLPTTLLTLTGLLVHGWCIRRTRLRRGFEVILPARQDIIPPNETR